MKKLFVETENTTLEIEGEGLILENKGDKDSPTLVFDRKSCTNEKLIAVIPAGAIVTLLPIEGIEQN